MTKYIVILHYNDGSQQYYGDPLFSSANDATLFGMAYKGRGSVMDFNVIPVNSSDLPYWVETKGE